MFSDRPRKCSMTRWMLLYVFLLTVPAVARHVEIQIVHTTDLHGRLFPGIDYDGNEDVGGVLRIAHHVKQMRTSDPDLILVDCGDLFQGSAESYLSGGRIMMDAINQLKYDVWTLGNHEFDWGIEHLAGLMQQTDVPTLAANITTLPGDEILLPKLRPFHIVDRKGVRIAVIGLITPGVPSWSRPHLIRHTLFKSSLEVLPGILRQVKDHDPDIIVLTTHQGYRSFGDDHANEVGAIAREFPEIDVIIGGHTHRPFADVRIGKTLYAQAGYHGIWLGVVRISYDTVENRIISKAGRLEHMDAGVPFDEELSDFWSENIEEVKTYLSERIGTALSDISPVANAKGESPMQELLCRAIKASTKADIIIHGVLNDEGLSKGPVTMDDAWRVVPYENTIGVAMLRPEEIKEVLAESLSFKDHSRKMGAYGCSYEVERDGSSVLVTDLKMANGKSMHPRKRYRVAFNSYVLASGGRRYNQLRKIVDRPEARLQMTGVDTRSALIQYVRKNKTVGIRE